MSSQRQIALSLSNSVHSRLKDSTVMSFVTCLEVWLLSKFFVDSLGVAERGVQKNLKSRRG